jgi:hypothetical protein
VTFGSRLVFRTRIKPLFLAGLTASDAILAPHRQTGIAAIFPG